MPPDSRPATRVGVSRAIPGSVCVRARVCGGGSGSVGSSMTVPAQSLMSAKLKRPGSISLYRSHQ